MDVRINPLMEDYRKVQETLDRLNHEEMVAFAPAALADGGTWHGNWQAEPGYFAVTGFEPSGTYGGTFNPGAGVPVKVFSNQRTGEIRTFLIRHFEV